MPLFWVPGNVGLGFQSLSTQECARFPELLQNFSERRSFFISQSNTQFQLDFNLHFVIGLDKSPLQCCKLAMHKERGQVE